MTVLDVPPNDLRVRCDSCGLIVAARPTPFSAPRGVTVTPPEGWAVEHLPGYGSGADTHRCPRCTTEGFRGDPAG